MHLTRRTALALTAGLASMAMLPAGRASAAVDDAIAAFTGGAEVTDGATAIMLLATGNPNPEVGTFTFGPLAASQTAATRIRLASTQDVVAIAKMADGTFVRASNEVKVTIGGCGG